MSALTEYSPSISWARQADRLAFTYYEDSHYTIWSVNNPRVAAPVAVPRTGAASRRRRARRRQTARRKSVSIAALLDSFNIGLPDTTRFRIYPYRVRLQADYATRPSVGYTPDALGPQRVRRNDAGAERHARQQPRRDLRRGERPPERSARIPRLHEPVAPRGSSRRDSRRRRTTSCRRTRCPTRRSPASRSRISRSRRTSPVRRSASPRIRSTDSRASSSAPASTTSIAADGS